MSPEGPEPGCGDTDPADERDRAGRPGLQELGGEAGDVAALAGGQRDVAEAGLAAERPREHGEGTKVVFTGDTSQIDAPYLGGSNNALAVLTQAFRGQRCFGHITLTACERSDVASLAAELL